MMPSRGLSPIASAARSFTRSTNISSRSLSTASPKSHLRTQLRRQYSPTINLISSRNLSWSSFGLGGSSSSPAPPQAAPSVPPAIEPQTATSGTAFVTPEPPASAGSGTFDADAVQNISDSFAATLPEQIGYLKSIGLEYGYGPTSILEWLLEHVHVYTGFPWWASILVTALTTRVVMFPLFVKSSEASARQNAMSPVTKPLSAKMMEAYKANDVQGVQKIRTELKEINQAAGIKMSHVFGPLLLQGVFAYSALKLMRAMANLPVPGLLDGGFLWIKDLTVADPTFALPVIMAATMHVFVRFGGETGNLAANDQPGLRALLLYGMPAIILASMSWFPAAVNLWLSSTGLSGILQAKLLQNQNIRNFFRLSPMVKPLTPETLRSSSSSRSPSPKTIDVTASSRSPSESTMRYQAPNVHYTEQSASASPSSDLAARGPGVLERTKTSATDNINAVAELWTDGKDWVKTRTENYVAGGQKVSKTRSKEFMKRAQAYERQKKEWTKK